MQFAIHLQSFSSSGSVDEISLTQEELADEVSWAGRLNICRVVAELLLPVSSSLVIYVTHQNKFSVTEEAPSTSNSLEEEAGQSLPATQSLKLQQLVNHKTM
jgi:hypothetical protein